VAAAADDDDKPDTAREAISTGSELYKVGVCTLTVVPATVREGLSALETSSAGTVTHCPESESVGACSAPAAAPVLDTGKLDGGTHSRPDERVEETPAGCRARGAVSVWLIWAVFGQQLSHTKPTTAA